MKPKLPLLALLFFLASPTSGQGAPIVINLETKKTPEQNKNETIYLAEIRFGDNPSQLPSKMSFASNEGWTLVASKACQGDCSCKENCYDEEKSRTFHLHNHTKALQVADNKF